MEPATPSRLHERKPEEPGCAGALCDTQVPLHCAFEFIDPEDTDSESHLKSSDRRQRNEVGATMWMDAEQGAGLAQGHHIWISILKVNHEPTASSLEALTSASDL